MKTRTPVGVDAQAIEDVDDRPDFHLQTCLFLHFTGNRRVKCLAKFDGATGQAPLALERFVGAAHQQNAAAVNDHRADAEDRARRNSRSDTHHLDDNAFFPLSVELGVKNLLPWSKIEFGAVIGSTT